MIAPEDEDTIERQLSVIETEALRSAAEQAEREHHAAALPRAAPLPAQVKTLVAETPLPVPATGSRGKVLYAVAAGGAILFILSVTIAYQLGTRARPVPQTASLETEPVMAMVPAEPTDAPQSLEAPLPILEQQTAAPVRIVNPFDRAEVFEFPPGTSYAEAREAAAVLLLERAQQRQIPRDLPAPSFALQESPGPPGTAR